MKTKYITVFMILVLVFLNATNGQSMIYSTISKNVNNSALSLSHNLNVSGDTLLLKSIFQLNKVEIISDNGFQSFVIEGHPQEVKIPLGSLGIGDYTISVLHTEGKDDTYIYQKTIVFKISRLKPINHLDSNSLAATKKVSNDGIAILNISGRHDDVAKSTMPLVVENPEKLTAVNFKRKNLIQTKEKYTIDTPESIIRNIDLQLNNIHSGLVEQNDKVYEIPYNLTYPRNGKNRIQSRANYRRTHLRPNGKPYD